MKQFKLIKTYPNFEEIGMKIFQSKDGFWIDEKGESIVSIINPKKYPEFWEEVKKKDYEILSFTFKEGDKIIYSIERISDGEVFCIRDTVTNPAGLSFKISEFYLDHNEDRLLCNGDKTGNGHINITKIEHYKEPVFITEDGVKMYKGDLYWYVLDINHPVFPGKIDSHILDHSNPNKPRLGIKQFSTKEKAEEYRNNLLLEEAKRRYPKGTKVKSSILDCKFVVEDSYIIYDDGDVSCKSKNGLDHFLLKDNKWAEIIKDKTLKDYENSFLLSSNTTYNCVKSVGIDEKHFYDILRIHEPKLYWIKVLQAIANDLNEDWIPKETNEKHYIVVDLGIKVRVNSSFLNGCAYFKSKELAQKAIDIMGDKLDYIFK